MFLYLKAIYHACLPIRRTSIFLVFRAGLGLVSIPRSPSNVILHAELFTFDKVKKVIQMLTRLRVNGFKNLVGVDIHFGPFTCIAGVNGVGKSNLFDAIRFLSDLTHMSLIEAAKSVRSEGQRNSDIRDLFHKLGDAHEPQMQFIADMIIPLEEIGRAHV